jgi:hypothetical protein
VKIFHSPEDLSMIDLLLKSDSFARSPVVEPIAMDVPKDTTASMKDTTASMDEDRTETKTRKGIRWSPNDMIKLRDCLVTKKSMQETCTVLQRTSGAVEAKTRALLTEHLAKGESFEKMAEFLQRDVTSLEAFLNGSGSLFAV